MMSRRERLLHDRKQKRINRQGHPVCDRMALFLRTVKGRDTIRCPLANVRYHPQISLKAQMRQDKPGQTLIPCVGQMNPVGGDRVHPLL